MSDPTARVLFRTAARIFEELSFLVPSPSAAPIGDAAASGAVVDFHGPFSGRLALRITRDILPTLSANMLGEEHAPDEFMERDVVGEIANVLCGNVLPQIAGSEPVFHLESPHIFDGPVPENPSAAFPVKAEICIGLDSGRAEVMLFASDLPVRWSYLQ